MAKFYYLERVLRQRYREREPWWSPKASLSWGDRAEGWKNQSSENSQADSQREEICAQSVLGFCRGTSLSIPLNIGWCMHDRKLPKAESHVNGLEEIMSETQTQLEIVPILTSHI